MQTERGKSQVAEGLSNMVLQLTQAAIQTTDNCSEALCIAASAGIAAVTAVSILVGKGKEADESCTKESMTYAALLVAATFQMRECDKHPGEYHSVGIDYGPHALLKAMQLYEQVMGEPPDAYLNPPLVKQTREYEQKTPPAKRVNPYLPEDLRPALLH